MGGHGGLISSIHNQNHKYVHLALETNLVAATRLRHLGVVKVDPLFLDPTVLCHPNIQRRYDLFDLYNNRGQRDQVQVWLMAIRTSD